MGASAINDASPTKFRTGDLANMSAMPSPAHLAPVEGDYQEEEGTEYAPLVTAMGDPLAPVVIHVILPGGFPAEWPFYPPAPFDDRTSDELNTFTSWLGSIGVKPRSTGTAMPVPPTPVAPGPTAPLNPFPAPAPMPQPPQVAGGYRGGGGYGNGGGFRPNGQAQYLPDGDMSWFTCNHDPALIGPGYGGQGLQCGFRDTAPFPGAKQKPTVMRNTGQVVWYCASNNRIR